MIRGWVFGGVFLKFLNIFLTYHYIYHTLMVEHDFDQIKTKTNTCLPI